MQKVIQFPNKMSKSQQVEGLLSNTRAFFGEKIYDRMLKYLQQGTLKPHMVYVLMASHSMAIDLAHSRSEGNVLSIMLGWNKRKKDINDPFAFFRNAGNLTMTVDKFLDLAVQNTVQQWNALREDILEHISREKVKAC